MIIQGPYMATRITSSVAVRSPHQTLDDVNEIDAHLTNSHDIESQIYDEPVALHIGRNSENSKRYILLIFCLISVMIIVIALAVHRKPLYF